MFTYFHTTLFPSYNTVDLLDAILELV